jgi:hypothetical protein
MSKHTPGPWYVGAQNDGLYIIDRQPRPSNDDPRHDADVELVATPFAARGATVEANARLIAAAPELLAALQDIIDDVEVQPWLTVEQSLKAREALTKATKATGESA